MPISIFSRNGSDPAEMEAPLPVVQVGKRGEERLRSRPLSGLGGDLREVPPQLPSGQWVTVTSRSGEMLGTATCNLSSRIAVRLVSRGAGMPSKTFLEEGIRRAIARRADAGLEGWEALRLVYSEGDFLPGLIVDRYGALLSVQILTAGMEILREEKPPSQPDRSRSARRSKSANTSCSRAAFRRM